MLHYTIQSNQLRVSPLESNAAQPSHFDRAINAMSELGLIGQAQQNGMQAILPLVERIAFIDQDNALFIARVMHYSGTFNEIVRKRIASTYAEDRTGSIISSFDVLSADINRMISWLEDGKLDWKEKIASSIMEGSRGSLENRFASIKEEFKADMRISNEQIVFQDAVAKAYELYFLANKDAESVANEMLSQSSALLDRCKLDLIAANEQIGIATTPSEKSSRELDRDVLIGRSKELESVNQTVNDIRDLLSDTHSSLELILLVLKQTLSVKRKIHESNITFIKSVEDLVTHVLSYTELVRNGNTTKNNAVAWNELLISIAKETTRIMSESGGFTQELKSQTEQSENCVGVSMAIENSRFSEILNKA